MICKIIYIKSHTLQTTSEVTLAAEGPALGEVIVLVGFIFTVSSGTPSVFAATCAT